MGTARALIAGSFLRTVDLFASIIAAFFIMPFVIQKLGDHWYGIWVIVGGFMGYYGLLDFGITSTTNRFIALHMNEDDSKGVNKAFNTSLGIFFVIGGGVLIISLIFAYFVPLFVEKAYDIGMLRKILLLMGIDIAISFPFRTFQSILSAKLRYDIISYISIVKTVLRVVLIVYFIGNGYSILSLAVISIFVNMIERLSSFVYSRKIFPNLEIKLSLFDKSKVREYLNYSFHSFIINIGDIIRFKLDIIVLAFFLGSAIVTHFNIALALNDYSSRLTMALIAGSLPVLVKYYSNNDYKNLREKFLMLTRFHLLISLTISGCVIILARSFLNLWMGHSYLDALIPLIILRSVSFLGVGQNSSIQVMYAMVKHKFYGYVTFGEALANLTLSLILVKPYGMIGVACGTAIPFIVTKLFIIPPYVCKLLNISIKQYYIQLIKFSFISLGAQLPFFLILKRTSLSSYTSMATIGGSFYLIYGFCMLNFLLYSEDRAYLTEAIPFLKKIIIFK